MFFKLLFNTRVEHFECRIKFSNTLLDAGNLRKECCLANRLAF